MITITYKNSNYSVDWSDHANLMYFTKQQRDNFEVADEFFFQLLTEKLQQDCDKYLDFIPKHSKKIMSVGSGVSIIELILSQYCTNAKIFLLDKSVITAGDRTTNPSSFSENNNHGFYHSWDVVTDAIKTSNLNEDRFVFLDPSDDWESDIDVVFSAWSWCWLYPFEVYSEKLLKSLKIGGTLILEIQNPPNLHDVPKTISELLGSEPSYCKRYNSQANRILKKNGVIRQLNIDSNKQRGGFYVWTRVK